MAKKKTINHLSCIIHDRHRKRAAYQYRILLNIFYEETFRENLATCVNQICIPYNLHRCVIIFLRLRKTVNSILYITI